MVCCFWVVLTLCIFCHLFRSLSCIFQRQGPHTPGPRSGWELTGLGCFMLTKNVARHVISCTVQVVCRDWVTVRRWMKWRRWRGREMYVVTWFCNIQTQTDKTDVHTSIQRSVNTAWQCYHVLHVMNRQTPDAMPCNALLRRYLEICSEIVIR